MSTTTNYGGSNNIKTQINNLWNAINSINTGGGTGNMLYTGGSMTSGQHYMASNSSGTTVDKSDIIENASTITFGSKDLIQIDNITASGFKTPLNSNQYVLLSDGTTAPYVSGSGQSNYYLYQNDTDTSVPPTTLGHIQYNNIRQDSATIVWINHMTSDNIDIDFYLSQITQNDLLYIQDKNDSKNWIEYKVNSTTVINNSYTAIDVTFIDGELLGLSSFGNNQAIFFTIFVDTNLINTRLNNLETKTRNLFSPYSTSTVLNNDLTFNNTLIRGNVNIENKTLTLFSGSFIVGSKNNNPNSVHIGSNAGTISTGAQTNILIGQNSGSTLNVGNDNIGIGDGTITFISGNQNINIGTLSGLNSTGNGNICLGHNAGSGAYVPYNGDNNIFIGKSITTATASLSNCIVIGANNSVVNSGEIVIGNSLNTNLKMGNIDGFFTGKFRTTGGLSSEFLKANGSVDTNSYALNSALTNYLSLGGGNMTGDINISNNAINTTKTIFTSGQLISKSYVDSAIGNYLLKSGGIMSGNIDMGTSQITNISKISTTAGTFNIGYNNTNNYTSTDLNILCGNNNTINANENIIFGVSNSITSNQTNVVGRGNNNINTGLGNVFGFFNSVISTSANVIGYNNNVGSTVAGYYTNCIGVGNICNGLYASAIGSNITNNTPNSLCLGDSAISTIYANSQVCDLGTSTKPYKDIYYSGEMKNKLDLQYINSFYIGIQYQHGSGVASTFSNSLWSALGSSSSVASTYALTNNFTRQLCCALWTTVALADGAICGYGSTSGTGIQVSMGYSFGLLSALGIADSVYSSNNCQNFWGLWNVATGIPLNQTTQLSVQRNMICFGSNSTDLNICIYTGGATSTVKQVDLGSNFPSNRPSGSLSTNFYRFSFYWDGTKIYYKAINTTLNITVQNSFTPLSTDIPASTISLYPQCVRVIGTPNANGQGRLQVQRFGVFY